MKFRELLTYLPFVRIPVESGDPEILNIEQDTRKVEEGTLFVCIEGSRLDGHLFAHEAVERGAVAIIASRPLDVPVPVAIVKDTRRAMAILSAAFYGFPSEKLVMIGVTGTNGKTSVSHMVEHIFRKKGKKTGLIGTLYTKIGDRKTETKNTTPDSLTLQKTFARMADEGVEVCSMEVSSHALHQGRVWGIDFDMAIFTNLTQDHLDYHGTMEEYKRVKGLFFSQLGNSYAGKRKFAILNADDPASKDYQAWTAANVVTYGLGMNADFSAEDIRYTKEGTTFSVRSPIGTAEMHLPLVGEFNVYNALAAIAAGCAYGFSLDDSVKALESFPGVPGRLELVKGPQPFPVLVDYAHTPDSLENVLKTVRALNQNGNIYVVVGCGGDRDRTKRPIMAQIACRYAEHPIFTSDNPRSEDPLQILKDMEKGVPGEEYLVIPDRREAIFHAVMNAGPDDVVLIAGKGHETYQIIGDKVIDFDDRLVAKEAIGQRFA